MKVKCPVCHMENEDSHDYCRYCHLGIIRPFKIRKELAELKARALALDAYVDNILQS